MTTTTQVDLADKMRATADEANKPHTLDFVLRYIEGNAKDGFYRAGFDSKRLSQTIIETLEASGFRVKSEFGTTWFHWDAAEPVNA